MFALIRFELDKLLKQKKSWVGVANIVLINILFAIAFYLRNQRAGQRAAPGFPDRLVAEFMNAYAYTEAILFPMATVMFPMILSILAAYMLAGEFELGNLRMMLFRPVARWKVLLGKWIAINIYGGVMLVVLGLASYAISSFMFRPSGDMIIPGALIGLPNPIVMVPEAELVWRIPLTYALAWPMLMSVTAMALMFAVITRHFTSAAIITTTVYFCSYIVGTLPFLSSIHPFLPTTYWPFFSKAVQPDIPWPLIIQHAGWTVSYTFSFLFLGIALFNMRDV